MTFDNGNVCECCETLGGGVQLYLDDDDNAVDLCTECYQMLTSHPSKHIDSKGE